MKVEWGSFLHRTETIQCSCTIKVSYFISQFEGKKHDCDLLAIQISDAAQHFHCRVRARHSRELVLHHWVNPSDRREGNEDSSRVNGIY